MLHPSTIHEPGTPCNRKRGQLAQYVAILMAFGPSLALHRCLAGISPLLHRYFAGTLPVFHRPSLLLLPWWCCKRCRTRQKLKVKLNSLCGRLAVQFGLYNFKLDPLLSVSTESTIGRGARRSTGHSLQLVYYKPMMNPTNSGNRTRPGRQNG